MKTLQAVVRIENQTKRPILFYKGQDNLECYTFEEQHSSACKEYYNDDTRAPHTYEDHAVCMGLVQHYRARLRLYDHTELNLVTRLS